MQKVGCVVIGGGLAGTVAALFLARAGQDVLLVEKNSKAHHKVCGEFLSTEAQDLLAFLGIDIWSKAAASISRVRIVVGTRQASARLPFKAAGFSRYQLDDLLLKAAVNAGSRVVRGEVASKLEVTAKALKLKVGTDEIQADRIVLATGKHNMKGYPRSTNPMTAFKQQLKISTEQQSLLRDVVQLAVFDGGYIGACFIEGSLVTICWTLQNELVKSIGPGWAAHRTFLSIQSPLLEHLLINAVPQFGKPVAVSNIPYGYLRKVVISSRLYPAGDQLAVIPSYTGDGTSIALYSGIKAAQAIIANQPAENYQREMIACLKSQFRWAGLANLCFENKLARYAGMSLSQGMPSFMTAIAHLTRFRRADLSEHVL